MEIFTASQDLQALDTSVLPEHLDSPNTLVLAFGGFDDREARPALDKIRRQFPLSVIAGCSTAGEIIGNEVEDGAIALAVAKFDATKLRLAALPIADASESEGLGKELAQTLATPDLAGVIVLADGMAVNGAELLNGMNKVFDPSIVVTGGLAGNNLRPATWVVVDGAPLSQWITCIGLYGSQIRIGHGSSGGWDTFGPPRTITKSVGTELFELDGKSAVALYRDYLGDLADGLPGTGLRFPLAIRRQPDDEDFVMRSIMGLGDGDSDSLIFAGDIPEGWSAQLMRGNLERLIEGAAQSARQTIESTEPAGPRLGIAISCVGRRGVLRERVDEELAATLDILGPGLELMGFYSNGEISPHIQGAAAFHNQTMTLTTIAEA